MDKAGFPKRYHWAHFKVERLYVSDEFQECSGCGEPDTEIVVNVYRERGSPAKTDYWHRDCFEAAAIEDVMERPPWEGEVPFHTRFRSRSKARALLRKGPEPRERVVSGKWCPDCGVAMDGGSCPDCGRMKPIEVIHKPSDNEIAKSITFLEGLSRLPGKIMGWISRR